MADAITTKNITSVDEVQSVDNTDKVFVNDNGSFKQISVSNLMKQAPSGVTEETDPTVSEWAKQPTKPSYTADEVGALPVGTKIPTKTSDLTNDSGYLTQIPEEYVTETELGQKGYVIEDDIPEKLPSPGILTFTGAVNDTYDGSANKTINIPTGGEGGGTEQNGIPSGGTTGQVLIKKSDSHYDAGWGTLSIGIYNDGKIYLFLNGNPIGEGVDIDKNNSQENIYGNPVLDTSILKLTSGQKTNIGIKLNKKPSTEQTITIISSNDLITLNKNSLTFNSDDWDDIKYIEVTVGNVENDITTSIIVRNSNELQTDTIITVYLISDIYSVDTTIPEDGHIITENDVTGMLVHDQYGAILKQYTGEYNNVIVPSSIEYNGKSYSPVVVSPDTFSNNDYVEYIMLEDGVKLSNSSRIIIGSIGQTNRNFAGASALIGIKIPAWDSISLNNLFEGCSSLKFVNGLESINKIIEMNGVFKNCTSLEYVQDLSEVSTDRNNKNYYTDGNDMFSGCISLKKVYGLPKLTNMTQAFYGCTNLEEAIIPETVGTYEFEHNGGYENSGYAKFAFYGCVNLKKITVLTKVATPDLPQSLNNDCIIYAIKGSDVYNNLRIKISSLPTARLLPYGSENESQTIVVWGDSTSSINTSWIDWPTRLENDLDGFTIKNQAVSGEYTTSTSARQGGNTLKVGGFTIPSNTTPVSITLKSEDGHTFGTNPVFSAGGAFNPCEISGVKGTILNNSGNYSFVRLENGVETEVADNTIVKSISDTSLNSADIMLINLGINSGWDENADVLLNQVQMMVNHFTDNGGEKYIICGPCSGKYLRNEQMRQVVFSYENKAEEAFGEHWLNLREYMIENGLTKNDLVASQLDTERMENGQVPASLLGGGTTEEIKMYNGIDVTDDTHPNAYGANTQYLAFYEKGVELGYWS